MKTSTKKYLDFLIEVYFSAKPINIGTFAKEKGVTSNIVSYLKTAGYIKGASKGTYDWVGREPDEAMVLEILKMQSDANKRYNGNEPKKTRGRSKTPIAIVFDQVWEGIDLAKKYGVPEEQWRDFVLEIYYAKKKKININTTKV